MYASKIAALTKKQKFIIGIAIILLAWLATCLRYPAAFNAFGDSAYVLFSVPIVTTAWILGVPGGLAAALLSMLLMFFLFPGDRIAWISEAARFPELIVMLICGIFVGWVSRLYYASLEQARDLKVEKLALEAENRLRLDAEEELQQLNSELEAHVAERTEQLTEANQKLISEIKERRLVEEQIQASLREKEVLLKEIHHRVKNNLQVISSLLNLQAQKIQDPAALIAFQESQNRVRTMSLIHEKLYQSKDLAEIDFSQYINHLAKHLVHSYRTASANISLNVQCEPVRFDVDTAVSCGLILNELISNALKYAFPENQPGELNVNLWKAEGQSVHMVVADNGVGFPADLDPHHTQSLGMQIVGTLVEQLNGTLSMENNHGSRVEIVFQRKVENNITK